MLLTQSSTISGNTAENAGGGVFAKYSRHYASSISGNTVTGRACDTTSNTKYCVPTILGELLHLCGVGGEESDEVIDAHAGGGD